MFHHLQVYLRQDRDLRLHFFKPPSNLAPSDSRKIRLRDTTDETTTNPSYSAPLIRIDSEPDNSSPMTQHSWRSFASAHLSPIKDYLAHPSDHQTPFHHHFRYHTSEVGCDDSDAKKQTSWNPFSSRRFANRSYSEPDVVAGTEKIVLLPGWASKRYRAGSELSNRTGAPYDIEMFVSGYVVKHRAPNALSRPQRTLLRLAKSFASLPKLPDLCHGEPHGNLPLEVDPLTNSEEDLLTKTVLRHEDFAELEEHALHQSPEMITTDLNPPPISRSSSSQGFPSPLSVSSSVSSSPSREHFSTSHTHLRPSFSGTNHLHIHRWHTNLETRLQPFWAGVISNRAVRVSVRPHFDLTEAEVNSTSSSELDILEQPLATYEAMTDADGAFKIRFVIPWESLCTHPKGAPVAFLDPNREHDFSVTAELMPPLPPLPSLSTPNIPTEPHPVFPPPHLTLAPIAKASERVPLTYSPIRVISDIDDTVKHSGIHCGARAVFHNVFVKDLEENLIPGMGEWYSEMWRRGVRFHYVSNGPFELLPVITDFFQLAKLPTGSVRLRSYGTRSLFSDLLSAPSDRKRDAVLEVLSSFPHSRFILIGDSGEQDLELYASVARDHPDQILSIFIRDVNTYEDGGGGIEDPIGTHAREGVKKRNTWGMSMSRGRLSPKSMSSQSLASSTMPRATSESTTNGDFSRTPSSSSATSGMQKPYTETHTLYAEPDTYDSSPHTQTTITPGGMPTLTHRLTLSESERKRMSLQARLWKACAEVPRNVVIRVFCDPLECVEAFQVIDPHLARESN